MSKRLFRNEVQLRWRLAGITHRIAELVPFSATRTYRAAWAVHGATYRAYERAHRAVWAKTEETAK